MTENRVRDWGGQRKRRSHERAERTALSLTAPITNAIFGHPVGDLAAHGEVLLAIENKNEQRAFDLMRGLLSHVAREVAEAKDLPRTPDRRSVTAPER